jgi:hypothetical protein
MWTLIFVVSIHSSSQSGVTSLTVNFKNKEACMAAQTALLAQATQRRRDVHNNMCVKGE